MSVKQVNKEPKTALQKRNQDFWTLFNLHASEDKPYLTEFKLHPYADIRGYQDYAVGQTEYHLNSSIDFKKEECKIGVYFRDLNAWQYYHSKKDIIDQEIGGHLVWTKHKTKGSAYIVLNCPNLGDTGKWEIITKLIISNLIILKKEFAKFVNGIGKRYWLVSWNEKDFRLHDYLLSYNLIDWNNKRNLKISVGDNVFLYCSSPESSIRYLMKVVRIEIPVEEIIDDSEYSLEIEDSDSNENANRFRLQFVRKITSDRLRYKELRANGLNGSPRSPIRVKGKLLEYILNATGDMFNDYDEIVNPEDIYEGAKKTVVVNRYERNRDARDRCIAAHGCKCSVCGLNFEEIYGELGRNFIHVHHIVPISTIGEEYRLDPIKDLIPVCPNCHAMLHRVKNGKVLTIDELKAIIDANKS